MTVTDEQLGRLAEPFPDEMIHWRQGRGNTQLAYIDARDVQNRLDEVCGPANWQVRHRVEPDRCVAEIGIRITRVGESEWVWKGDGAGDTAIEGEKGGLSDAFKRAAVMWGIGRHLYSMPTTGPKPQPAPPQEDNPHAAITKQYGLEAAARAKDCGMEPKDGIIILVDAMRAAGVADANAQNWRGKLVIAYENELGFGEHLSVEIEKWAPKADAVQIAIDAGFVKEA